MGAKEEAELLKKRALEFLENAKENLEKGRFALSAFSAEQSVQLLLKYFLFIKSGDYPKTHSLKVLFKLASSLLPEFKAILKEKIQLISNLEAAYIGSRYLPFEYTKEEVEEMIEFAKKIEELISNAL